MKNNGLSGQGAAKPAVRSGAKRASTAVKRSAPLLDSTPGENDYTAASIEVLEGLEPVRRRPGMYVGGTDEAALASYLRAEALDNAMDEAVAGHATFIDVALEADGSSSR